MELQQAWSGLRHRGQSPLQPLAHHQLPALRRPATRRRDPGPTPGPAFPAAVPGRRGGPRGGVRPAPVPARWAGAGRNLGCAGRGPRLRPGGLPVLAAHPPWTATRQGAHDGRSNVRPAWRTAV